MRLLTAANLRWVVRHRAWTPYYLKRYWRFAWFKLRHPQVITEGFVFLGKKLEIVARPGHGRLIIGKWVHLGDETRLRAHEGTLRIGDKVVFARDVTVNCYLDIEIGASTLIADWTYICDFDHKTEDLGLPIKDQGLVKSPVRIGPDCWLATKVTVTRGADIGRGVVIGANSVARGNIPEYSVAVGIPAVVVRDRVSRYEAEAERRAYLAELARGNEETAARLRAGRPPVDPPAVEEREAADDPAAGAGAVPAVEERDEADDAAGEARVVPDGAGEVRVPDSAAGNGLSTTGDKGDVSRGFSSYSPVGHYVPEVVEEETQRG
ncbi:acyltransferase [Kribbella sp. VKM Ac-2568]|uniref:acyltransferase n=1 Tax=Kribbella sp. VKM Ac-2568 TaxID=2512219 RepID=UPI0010EFB349|nr:acyltransferase [Kribbella sp. VKM Ac-2568]TCM40975.1 acetyltransferase-like isoleucine patch superfamily enzyme [Kribbella sp. VKM Ac-2568]